MAELMAKIENKFKQKRLSCQKRGIPFLFTLEDFVIFMEYRNSTTCAYTDVEFIEPLDGEIVESYPTIERVDGDGPYSKENCIWVTQVANNVKACCFDDPKSFNRRMSIKKLTKKTKPIYNRITKFLSDPQIRENVIAEYSKIYSVENSKKAEEIVATMKQEDVLPPAVLPQCEEVETTLAVKELELARCYIEFITSNVTNGPGCIIDSNITVGQFKKLMNKKRCQISNELFEESDEQVFTYVKYPSDGILRAVDVVVVKRSKYKAFKLCREFMNKTSKEESRTIIQLLRGIHD